MVVEKTPVSWSQTRARMIMALVCAKSLGAACSPPLSGGRCGHEPTPTFAGGKSGAEATALQALARLRCGLGFREASGAARSPPLLDLPHADSEPTKIFTRTKAVLKPPHSPDVGATAGRFFNTRSITHHALQKIIWLLEKSGGFCHTPATNQLHEKETRLSRCRLPGASRRYLIRRAHPG